MTRAKRGTPKENLCQELGLESLQKRWRHLKLSKVFNKQFPKYLINTTTESNRHTLQVTWMMFLLFKVRHDFFKKLLFSCCCNWMKQAWQKFSENRMSYIFKENTLKFIRPFQIRVYNCRNLEWTKLFSRFRIGLSIFVNTNLSIFFKTFSIRDAIRKTSSHYLFLTVQVIYKKMIL